MGTTLTITAEQRAARDLVAGFASFMDTPPDIRECLTEALRENIPDGITAEQVGWTLTAVSTALMTLVRVALTQSGTAEDIVAPRMLAALCSAAEGFITEADLSALEQDLV